MNSFIFQQMGNKNNQIYQVLSWTYTKKFWLLIYMEMVAVGGENKQSDTESWRVSV